MDGMFNIWGFGMQRPEDREKEVSFGLIVIKINPNQILITLILQVWVVQVH